jgi:hypothetical protein
MRAYRTELDPNNAQRMAFMCHAGAARWAFNDARETGLGEAGI